MMKPSIDSAQVLPNLPDHFHPNQGDPIPDGLVGSKIIRMGTFDEVTRDRLQEECGIWLEGGGLVIDYLPPCGRNMVRVIFGFNESGMWEIRNTEFICEKVLA